MKSESGIYYGVQVRTGTMYEQQIMQSIDILSREYLELSKKVMKSNQPEIQFRYELCGLELLNQQIAMKRLKDQQDEKLTQEAITVKDGIKACYNNRISQLGDYIRTKRPEFARYILAGSGLSTLIFMANATFSSEFSDNKLIAFILSPIVALGAGTYLALKEYSLSNVRKQIKTLEKELAERNIYQTPTNS